MDSAGRTMIVEGVAPRKRYLTGIHAVARQASWQSGASRKAKPRLIHQAGLTIRVLATSLGLAWSHSERSLAASPLLGARSRQDI